MRDRHKTVSTANSFAIVRSSIPWSKPASTTHVQGAAEHLVRRRFVMLMTATVRRKNYSGTDSSDWCCRTAVASVARNPPPAVAPRRLLELTRPSVCPSHDAPSPTSASSRTGIAAAARSRVHARAGGAHRQVTPARLVHSPACCTHARRMPRSLARIRQKENIRLGRSAASDWVGTAQTGRQQCTDR
jgi:hypothetical protein